ncbi:MAG TPA: hypothetical protein PKL06_05270 [Chitinophagales bacterium]|nr:hypothetical protein [Chitinophagales bacterium]
MHKKPTASDHADATSWKWWYLAVAGMLVVDILVLFYLTNRYQ